MVGAFKPEIACAFEHNHDQDNEKTSENEETASKNDACENTNANVGTTSMCGHAIVDVASCIGRKHR